MCDENFEQDLETYSRFPHLTRRQFGVASMGAGLLITLPRAADALDVKEQDVTIKTPDGECDAYFVHPASGASAAVLVWPDILGLRPAFRKMGKRLAESGYAVLTVNPFYRAKKSPVVPEGASFADPAVSAVVRPLAGQLNAETHVTDARAFVSWLDQQTAVDKRKKIGTTGYCMGGPIVMRTAGTVPDRIGAGCSFHGGGLTTKNPDSPHLLVPKMKASFLFCVAENDDQRDPTSKDILRETYAKAKLPAEIEVYAAAHGWCPPDSAVYNEALAEKAWSRMLALFKTALA